MAFKNPFLSYAGQVERLKNVAGTLTAIATGKKVYANTPYSATDKALELTANNPLVTAGIIGTVANIPKAVQYVQSAPARAMADKASTQALNSPGLISPPAGGQIGGTQKTLSDGKVHVKPDSSRAALAAVTTPAAKNDTGPGLIQPSTIEGGTSTKTTRTRTTKRRSSTRKSARKPARKRVKRSRRVRSSRKRSKKHYGTAKQYARKGGKSVKYTKNGQPYIILASGKARFVKGRRKR